MGSWFSALFRGWWDSLITRARSLAPDEIDAVGPASWLWTAGGTIPHTYDKLYRTQPHVQTVVNFLAINMGQIGIKVFRRRSGNDRVEVHEHPLAILLRQPNPFTTRYRFMVELVTDFCVDGFAVALKVRPQSGGLDLYRIEPEMVTVIEDVVPRAVAITPKSGGRVVFPISEVVYLRQPRGVPPLEALRGLLSEDLAAGQYRSKFWQNYARLGGVIQRPATAPRWQPPQRKLFRKQWRQYQGAANAGRTVVLEDGMTYQQVSATAEQSQLVQTRKLTREEVAAAYHVPPAMVGIVESQGYGSIREQHKALYQDTLGPYVAMFESDFLLQLGYEFVDQDNIYVEFNVDEKLQGSFEESTSALASATGSAYLSVNEARARLNLPKIADPAYDKPILRLDTAGGQASAGRTNGNGAPTPARNGNGNGNGNAAPIPLDDFDFGPFKEAIRGGAMTLAEAIRALTGRTFDEVIRERQAELEALDRAGIVTDTDPRATSAAGLTQARPPGTTLPDSTGKGAATTNGNGGPPATTNGAAR